ncbi:hypothetical protein J4427_02330 [Candidatus Woesearchaeota archaeon]|nr:hypothetical protein [Candidatus Woesearchaeota archaeon]
MEKYKQSNGDFGRVVKTAAIFLVGALFMRYYIAPVCEGIRDKSKKEMFKQLGSIPSLNYVPKPNDTLSEICATEGLDGSKCEFFKDYILELNKISSLTAGKSIKIPDYKTDGVVGVK